MICRGRTKPDSRELGPRGEGGQIGRMGRPAGVSVRAELRRVKCNAMGRHAVPGGRLGCGDRRQEEGRGECERARCNRGRGDRMGSPIPAIRTLRDRLPHCLVKVPHGDKSALNRPSDLGKESESLRHLTATHMALLSAGTQTGRLCLSFCPPRGRDATHVPRHDPTRRERCPASTVYRPRLKRRKFGARWRVAARRLRETACMNYGSDGPLRRTANRSMSGRSFRSTDSVTVESTNQAAKAPADPQLGAAELSGSLE